MNAEQTQVIHECARGALTGELNFPEIVGRLALSRPHNQYDRKMNAMRLQNDRGDSI